MPISAIEHYSYCARQCALIHVEQTYDENLYTLRGRLSHERVHSGATSSGNDVRVLRAVELWSERYGLRGKADVVEIHGTTPYPIEYKSGPRIARHAELQLCAQALCLEEMTGQRVEAGAIYSASIRRRQQVTLDKPLRSATIAAIEAVRTMLREQAVPPPVNDTRCPRCSLRESCLPETLAARNRLRGLQSVLFQPWGEPSTSS